MILKSLLVVLMLSATWGAWGQTPTLDDCDKAADAGSKLFSDLRGTKDAGEKAEMMHYRDLDKIDAKLGECLLLVRIKVSGREFDEDLLRLYDYADIDTKLLREEYDTLHSLTEKLQALIKQYQAECR